MELVSSSVLSRLLHNLGKSRKPACVSVQTNDNSPGSILIAYTSVGLIVYVVMTALGEMAAWIPHASGFAGYATRFCDPALGFALGWTYWCKYVITTPNQLTATALILQEWKSRDEVNPGVWIAVFLVAIIAINYFGIKFFGELEFWLSSIKVVTIVSDLLLTLKLQTNLQKGRCHLAVVSPRGRCWTWWSDWFQVLRRPRCFQAVHHHRICRQVLRFLELFGQCRLCLPWY